MPRPSQSPARPQDQGRKRGRIACSQCRQAKIRCGLEQIPCSRCERLDLDCSINPSYIRVSKKDKVKELEQQVQSLHDFIEHQHDGGLPVPRSSPGSSVQNGADPYHTGTINHDSSPQSSVSHPAIAPKTGDIDSRPNQDDAATRVLGHTTISQKQTRAMFATYFKHYHHFLPILEPTRSEATYYNTSVLLFWSVIAVAARQLRSDEDLLSRLAPELNQRLWTTLATSPLSLATVQAMLLLSCWPLPNVRLWTDKSWILSNLAMNTSIQLGMHRPGSEIGYSKDTLPVTRGDIADRACAWFASVALCQCLSVDLGHGPTAHFDDWTVRAVCEGSSFDDIPSELRHSLMIEKTNHDALLLLSKYARGPFGVPFGDNGFDIIWECERGFDELLSTLEPQLSLTNRLDLQHARLHIQCVYFLYDEDNSLRLPGLLRAYSTASDIVNTILSDETSHDVLPHAPLRVVRIIFNAALVIFRILHSTCAAGLDYKGGRLLFNAAAFSMRQLSVLQKDKDQPLRASEMLRAFWRAAERNPSMSSQAPKLHIKSRLGASLAYDCLLLFRSKSSDNRARGPDGPTQNNQPLAGEISQNTPSPISNGLPDPMFLPAAPPTDLDLSVFPEGILSISPNIDMTDTVWLQDIGYPAFPDLEVWQR